MIKRTAKNLLWRLPLEHRRRLFKNTYLKKYGFFPNLPYSTLTDPEGSSLRPFYDNRCIFVHIPKAAGISVGTGLFGGATGNHLSVLEYQMIFNEGDFEQFFKFTFVRNPWDRAVSAYFFLKKGGRNQGDLLWSQHHLSEYRDFDAFVKGWLTEKNVHSGRHFRPQYSYLCLPGKSDPVVDFIGRYETLGTDYEIIRAKLGVGTALNSINVTEGKQKDYRDYYSDETKEIVANVYRKDIELFGYDFENRSVEFECKT